MTENEISDILFGDYLATLPAKVRRTAKDDLMCLRAILINHPIWSVSMSVAGSAFHFTLNLLNRIRGEIVYHGDVREVCIRLGKKSGPSNKFSPVSVELIVMSATAQFIKQFPEDIGKYAKKCSDEKSKYTKLALGIREEILKLYYTESAIKPAIATIYVFEDPRLVMFTGYRFHYIMVHDNKYIASTYRNIDHDYDAFYFDRAADTIYGDIFASSRKERTNLLKQLPSKEILLAAEKTLIERLPPANPNETILAELDKAIERGEKIAPRRGRDMDEYVIDLRRAKVALARISEPYCDFNNRYWGPPIPFEPYPRRFR